jgi:2'-5' RNA ligase
MGMKFRGAASGLVFYFALALWFTAATEASGAEPAKQGEVVAIDVLLHPDATMLAAAAKANAALRGNYAEGFALDKLHTPHISMIQRFVRRDDLPRIYAELAKVFAEERPTSLELEAVGYYSLPVGDLGLAGIVVKPTAELRELQQRIIAVVEPLAVQGTSEAFVPSPDGGAIAPSIVAYVNGYVPERSGKDFNPHVTVGLGKTPFVKRMVEAPFATFDFKATGASVYHLGNYGTAAVELWSNGGDRVAK